MYFNDGDEFETETSSDDLASDAQCDQTGSVPYGTVE